MLNFWEFRNFRNFMNSIRSNSSRSARLAARFGRPKTNLTFAEPRLASKFWLPKARRISAPDRLTASDRTMHCLANMTPNRSPTFDVQCAWSTDCFDLFQVYCRASKSISSVFVVFIISLFLFFYLIKFCIQSTRLKRTVDCLTGSDYSLNFGVEL